MRDALVLEGRKGSSDARFPRLLGLADTGPEIRGGLVLELLPKRAPRVEGYDWIRLLAAINVIVFHVAPTPDGFVGRGGVPAFLMIAASLPAMHFEIEPFAPFAIRRARRILIPWLFWCGLFGVLAGVRYCRHGIVPEWTIHDLFVGTAMHLWFFPAVFAGTLLAWILLCQTRSWGGTTSYIGALASAFALFGIHAWLSRSFALPAPYGQWVFAGPALVIGVALGLAHREQFLARRRGLLLGVALVTILGAAICGLIGETGSAISYCVAGLTVPAALLLPIRSGALVQSFTRVSLGVYASHPFIYLGLRSLVSARPLSIWIGVPAVFIGSVTFSVLLRKVPWGKAVV